MRECSCSRWLGVLYHMVVACEEFSTAKKVSQSFSCMVFTKYLGMKSFLRGNNGLFHAYFLLSGEKCGRCYAELDLCLYLTGSSYHLSYDGRDIKVA